MSAGRSAHGSSPRALFGDLSEEGAAIIVKIASRWTERSDCLPDHLRVRVELAPNQNAEAKYFQEFLTLDECCEFSSECRAHLASVRARRRQRQVSLVAPGVVLHEEADDAEARGDIQFGSGEDSFSDANESRCQEAVPGVDEGLRETAVDVVDDVQMEPNPAEGSVSSCTNSRREGNLKSDLGKYWELPEGRPRRARKQTSFFSPY